MLAEKYWFCSRLHPAFFQSWKALCNLQNFASGCKSFKTFFLDNLLVYSLQGAHGNLERPFNDQSYDDAQGTHDYPESRFSSHLSDATLYTAPVTSGELLACRHCLCTDNSFAEHSCHELLKGIR